MSIASFIVLAVKAYFAIGLATGLVFILFEIDAVDRRARGAFAFRPLLLPGFALIWPLALACWRGATTREEGEN